MSDVSPLFVQSVEKAMKVLTAFDGSKRHEHAGEALAPLIREAESVGYGGRG